MRVEDGGTDSGGARTSRQPRSGVALAVAVLTTLLSVPLLPQTSASLLPIPQPSSEEVATAEHEEPNDAPSPLAEAEEDVVGDGVRTLGRLPKNVWRGATGLYSRHNIDFFVAGAMTMAIATQADDRVSDSVGDEDDTASSILGDLGGPVGLGVALTGALVVGRFVENPRTRALTYDMATAAIVNLGYTMGIKRLARRTRPDDSDDDAFPSGHTSSAFALAAVANGHYGPRIGIPAYVAAGVIGVSRVRKNAHWLSDVVAGATLGHVVGATVVRRNGGRVDRRSGPTVTVAPILTGDERGLWVHLSF